MLQEDQYNPQLLPALFLSIPLALLLSNLPHTLHLCLLEIEVKGLIKSALKSIEELAFSSTGFLDQFLNARKKSNTHVNTPSIWTVLLRIGETRGKGDGNKQKGYAHMCHEFFSSD